MPRLEGGTTSGAFPQPASQQAKAQTHPLEVKPARFLPKLVFGSLSCEFFCFNKSPQVLGSHFNRGLIDVRSTFDLRVIVKGTIGDQTPSTFKFEEIFRV